MRALNPYRTAFVLATLVGGWHLLWSALVLLGWAQVVIDFIFWIHFLKPVYVVEPFEIGRCLILVAVTAGVGAAAGYCFTLLWNGIHE